MISFDALLRQGGARRGIRSIRRMFGRDRTTTLRDELCRLKVVTYNLALMVFPGSYHGTDRAGAIAEFCARIRQLQPDIVGICEAFADDERDQIAGQLPFLPHRLEGPDEDDFESDGGLLLLSRHPFEESGQIIFRETSGPDSFANKGAVFARVRPPGFPSTLSVFYTHCQALYGDDDDVDALRNQLSVLGDLVRRQREPNTPALLMGDLNVPGMNAAFYGDAMSRLGSPIDLWLAQQTPNGPGTTNVHDNDFYDDPDDDGRPKPGQDERLDYVLLYPGAAHVPLMDSIEILRWTRNGRQISDHFGLHATFSRALSAEATA